MGSVGGKTGVFAGVFVTNSAPCFSGVDMSMLCASCDFLIARVSTIRCTCFIVSCVRGARVRGASAGILHRAVLKIVQNREAEQPQYKSSSRGLFSRHESGLALHQVLFQPSGWCKSKAMGAWHEREFGIKPD